MPPSKSAVEEFLGKEGETSLIPDNKDPFAGVETEVKPEVKEEIVEDKPLPFHKDPKIKKYVEKEITKAIQAIRENPSKSQDAEVELPDSLVRLIGNDTDEKKAVLKDFSKYLGSLKDEAAKVALNQFQEQAKAAAAEDKRAQEELDGYFEEIEDTFKVDMSSNTQGARKLRSDFIEYVRRIAPKDENGDVTAFPDLNAAFEEFQDKQKRSATPNRAKELASRSLVRSGDTTVAPIEDNSWKGVEKMLNNLSN